MTVAALYVDAKGVYAGLPGVEVWDLARDARLYAGPWPVVAHPPCGRWTRALSALNEKRWGARIGSDGGCFAAAVSAVRRYGGVLEHPAQSRAWDAHRLTRPMFGAWIRDFWDHAWVTEVHQSAYGHPARKATWLYFCGENPPCIDWRSPETTARVSQMSHGDGGKRCLKQREAAATPPAFRDLLLSIARTAEARAA